MPQPDPDKDSSMLSVIIPEPDDVPLGVSVPVEVTHYTSPIRMFLKYNFASDRVGNWDRICSPNHLYSAYVGMFCVVFCEDTDSFQRAQVTDIHSDDNGIQVAVEVFYVDRGDVDIVGLDSVLPINQRIAALPNLTVPCCIRKVRPTVRSTRHDLRELASNGNGLYEAVFRGVSDAGVFDVDLFMVDTNSRQRVERRNVADLLVQRGLAAYLLYPIKTVKLPSICDGTSEPSNTALQVTANSAQGAVRRLPPPVLPAVGLVDLSVTHVVTPGHWYGHLVASEMQLRSIEGLLAPTRANEMCRLKGLEKGIFCVFKETPLSAGYRAKIEHVTARNGEEQNVQITLIDYGEMIGTTPACLYGMDTGLASYPPLALKFQLNGVCPWGVWTEAAVFKFKRLLKMNEVASVIVSAQVVAISGVDEKLITVNLIDNAAGNLGDVLIREGYARKPARNELSHDEHNSIALTGASDPMTQDYESFLNNYTINTDDPSVATTQCAIQNKAGVCHFYSRKGSCRFGDRCSYRHIPCESNTMLLRDSHPVPHIEPVRTPDIGSRVLAQISAIASPRLFFLVFPYGTKDVSKLAAKHGGRKETLDSLIGEMQREYRRRTFDGTTLMLRAEGEIVAAYSSHHQQWLRARVIATNHHVIRVQYPDFGDMEWVRHDLVRDLKVQFQHLPLQAVQACLACVLPAEQKLMWDEECICAMSSWCGGKVLLVEVIDCMHDVLHVQLYTYEGDHLESVREKLIDAKLAASPDKSMK